MTVPVPLSDDQVRQWIAANLPVGDFRAKRVLMIVPDHTRTAPLPLLFDLLHALLAPVGEHAHFDQAMRLQRRVGFLQHRGAQPFGTDDHDRVQVMGLSAQRLAFGSRVSGQSFGTATTAPKRINLLRLEEDLSAAHLRLSNVIVEQLPWQRCVERYDAPHTLFLLDPPYWETEGYGQAFGIEQYDELVDVMAHLKGRAILTINDHPEMRRRFDRFRGKTVVGILSGGNLDVAELPHILSLVSE